MDLKRVAVSSLKQAPYNPRVALKPGDPEFEKLRRSIERFGVVEPLIWNERTGYLVGGHQRLAVLVAAGATEVDVSVVDLPPEQEKLLNLALNRISGDWDPDRLAALLEELVKLPEVDVALSGFDAGEISRILDEALKIEEPAAPEPPTEGLGHEPVTQLGELIEVGPHRILCADAADPETLQRLLGDEKAAMVFSDPPYRVAYEAERRPGAAARGASRWQGIANDDLSEEEYRSWLDRVFTNMAARLAPGAPLYIFNGFANFGLMHDLLARHGIHISCVITWAKPTAAPGFADYAQQTEFCLYGWAPGGTHPWHGPDNETTLWEVPRDPAQTLVHPTQKPAGLARRAIRNSSTRGDLVLDLFLGSGSTLVAAQALGRRCFGTELDPAYVDAIVRRFIDTFGEEAVSAETRERYGREEG